VIPLVLLAVLGLGLAITAASDTYARATRAAAAHTEADARLASASAAASVASQQMLAAISAQQAAALAAPPPSTIVVAPPAPAPVPPPTPAVAPPSPSPSQAADAHADAAQLSVDAAVEHAVAATQANQAAAQSTADMAKSAKTAEEKAAAAASAAAVLERERKIAALGVGQCGIRSYARVNSRVKDQLIAKLHAAGMSVTGTNPWDIETHKYGVRLRAVWSPTEEVLKLIVTTGKGAEVIPFLKNVTCDDIWDEIDPILKQVIGV
jgi:pyruvate dehydrogenase E2 component (dihydrolipoamide acetyltransferase)